MFLNIQIRRIPVLSVLYGRKVLPLKRLILDRQVFWSLWDHLFRSVAPMHVGKELIYREHLEMLV